MRYKNTILTAVLCLIAGISLALPFMAIHMGSYGLICMVPVLYLMYRTDKIRWIWLSGFISMLIIFYWLAVTDPDFLAGGLSNNSLYASVIAHYIITALLFSSGYVLFAFLFKLLNLKRALTGGKKIPVLPILLFAAVWVACESLRGWAYTTVLLGPNTTAGPHSNFANIAYPEIFTAFVFSTRIVGLFGLGFLIVILNIAIFRLTKSVFQKNRLNKVIPEIFLLSGISIVLLSISAAGLFIYLKPSGQKITVAALQVGADNKNLPSTEVLSGNKDLLSNADKSDLLVLPEHSEIFGEDLNNPHNPSLTNAKNDAKIKESQGLLAALAKNDSLAIITSRDRYQNSDKYNTLTVYDHKGQIKYERDKQLIVPVGESVPYLYEYFFNLAGKNREVSQLKDSRGLTKGKLPDQTYNINGIKIGSAVCSSVLKPELYRKQASGGAEILTNSASLGMFDKSSLYHIGTFQMAKFISVSNARPYVQSTKGSVSLILDSNGGKLRISSRDKSELLVSGVTTNNTKTVYTLLGEWVLYLSFAGIIAAIAVKLVQDKRPEKHSKQL